MRRLQCEEKPNPIQLVMQRVLDDCAICCLAMVSGLPYETVLAETGSPEFIKCLKEKRSLPDRQREMNEKFNMFLLKRGYGIIPVQPPLASQPGRRYIANVTIRHPETQEPSALEHNIVIDEKGAPFNPSPDAKPPYSVCALREIVFVGG